MVIRYAVCRRLLPLHPDRTNWLNSANSSVVVRLGRLQTMISSFRARVLRWEFTFLTLETQCHGYEPGHWCALGLTEPSLTTGEMKNLRAKNPQAKGRPARRPPLRKRKTIMV